MDAAGSDDAGRLVPELPVGDVERAQRYYRDVFGFAIGWITEDKTVGAVSRAGTAIFFRRREGSFEPAVHWVHAVDIDATYARLTRAGAHVVDALERKPWGLRQFTIVDVDGHRYHYHSDTPEPTS